MPDDDRPPTGLLAGTVGPEIGPTRSRHASPPVLSLKGGSPLVEAGFRQSEIVVGMGCKLS